MNDTASIFRPYADLAHLGASENGGYPKAWVSISISILNLPNYLDDLGVPPFLKNLHLDTFSMIAVFGTTHLLRAPSLLPPMFLACILDPKFLCLHMKDS